MAMTASRTRAARSALFLVTALAVLVTAGGTDAFASQSAGGASRALTVTRAAPAQPA
jgi:hypothetical protein